MRSPKPNKKFQDNKSKPTSKDEISEGSERKPGRSKLKSDRSKGKVERPDRKIERPVRKEWKSDRPKKSYESREESPERTDRKTERPERKEWKSDRPKKTYESREGRPERTDRRTNRPERADKKTERPERKEWKSDHPKKTYASREGRPERADRKTDRPERKDWNTDRPKKSYEGDEAKTERKEWKTGSRDSKPDRRDKKEEIISETIRLNRLIANAGICSRREADDLIRKGKIEVNGKVVTELGVQIKIRDKVKYEGRVLESEKHVYILLNKPKDFITTVSDTHGRKTVMDLIRRAGRERVVPVGRLDKNTTGLLLFTNDGDLTKRLTHPSHGVRKLYHISAHKTISDEDIEKLAEGFELEDGFIRADEVSRIEKGGRNEIGILMHSGKNRIVRRMLEHLGYRVVKLDRVIFANLTKKDLPRGKWRKLGPKEVTMLKRIVGGK